MATINQLIRKGRSKNNNSSKYHLLSNQPQIRAVCSSIVILKPRKPNSAARKVAKVRCSNKKVVYAYIAGVGHSLQEYSNVLLKGQGPNDLPGVNFTIVRGVWDCKGVVGRKTSRSKYGLRKVT